MFEINGGDYIGGVRTKRQKIRNKKKLQSIMTKWNYTLYTYYVIIDHITRRTAT